MHEVHSNGFTLEFVSNADIACDHVLLFMCNFQGILYVSVLVAVGGTGAASLMT